MSKKLISLLMVASLLLLITQSAFASPNVKSKNQPGWKSQEKNLQQVSNQDKDKDEEESVTGSVYGKADKERHMGIPNALLHVKNPQARAVLQAILDGRSVSEAVYAFKNNLDSVDATDVEIITNEIDAQISQDDSANSNTAITYKLMAQIHMKKGKLSEALRYMENSALRNPVDDETYMDLDRIHANQNNLAVKVYVNGKTPVFDVPPRIVNGRTLVPIRFIAEGLNANVSYNAETDTVTITGPGLSVEMKINSTTAVVNGEEVQLDVPAAIENGRTMAPLRFIGEGFKCKVKFYGESNLVSVNK